MVLVVDPWHWLTEEGELPEIPRLRRQTLKVVQLIEYGGTLPAMHGRETLVPCGRRPKRKQCPGLLVVAKMKDNRLHAYCPACRGEEYWISNWESTQWAEGPMGPVPMKAT